MTTSLTEHSSSIVERPLCSIELDEGGFWHVNIYEDVADWSEVPDGTVPDAYATTKTGASVEDAIELARTSFNPSIICVWDTCEYCSGTREDAEGNPCDECDGEGIRCEDIGDGSTEDDTRTLTSKAAP